MKKKVFSFLMLFSSSPMVVFAYGGAKTYTIVKNASQSLLRAFSWVGYAIALGILMVIGVKYVISGASEKANLKSKLPLYLLGMILMATAGTTARFLAITAGNQDADTVIDTGIELSGVEVGHRDRTVEEDHLAMNLYDHKVYAPEGVELEGKVGKTDNGKYEIVSVEAAPKYDTDGNEFLYWKVTDEDGNVFVRPAGRVDSITQNGKSSIKAVYSEGMTSFNVKDLDKIDKVVNDAKVFAPNGVDIEYHNKVGFTPKLEAPANDDKNNKFKYWLLEEYNPQTGETKLSRVEKKTLELAELEDKNCSGLEYRCIAVYNDLYR